MVSCIFSFITRNCFFKKTDTNITMLNGYIIAQPIHFDADKQVRQNKSSCIVLPDWVKESMDTSKSRFGKVLAVGRPNVEYLNEKLTDVKDLAVDDIYFVFQVCQ